MPFEGFKCHETTLGQATVLPRYLQIKKLMYNKSRPKTPRGLKGLGD
ncbi:MAG: hypothetical protein CM15mP74_27330 [Halieaceae bacterium]|nr:MAG: hypothetical protein CM15mP74_27330 [Halieaceae bacterium]